MYGCNQQQLIPATLYLANQSINEYDSVILRVYTNDDMLIEDTVVNTYTSEGYWQEYSVELPANDFIFKIRVEGEDYKIEKDTTILARSDMKVFASFNFTPFQEKYNNPEIYQHLPSSFDNVELKRVADSLYENNIINAGTYLNDSLPTSKAITLSTNLMNN